jgi:uncharacterized protein
MPDPNPEPPIPTPTPHAQSPTPNPQPLIPMRIFALGDLHLAGGTGKTMDRFGDHWINHDQKIFDSWKQKINPDDLVIIAGDTTWAMRLDQALPDLQRIGEMPGLKILIKGNHDYWWHTLTKLRRALPESIQPLQAGFAIIDRVAVAGTRGWLCPNDSYFRDQDRTVYEREIGRLRSALTQVDERRSEFDSLIVALHYPPTSQNHESTGFTELIDEYQVDTCVYGHLHGDDIRTALTGFHRGVRYYLVSADAAGFEPVEIVVPNKRSDNSED